MGTFELLTHPAAAPFAVALGLMLSIVFLELVLVMLGLGVGHWLDGLVPDAPDAPDMADVSADVDVHPGVIGHFLGWLYVGRVPVLMILLCFLACFGLAGLLLQSLLLGIVGFALPVVLAVPAAIAVALPATRLSGRILAALIPSDETSAVRLDSFVGLTAVVTLGDAHRGDSAEARLRDRYGQVHYIRVEPEADAESLPQGSEVLLVRHLGHNCFIAIPNPNPVLSGRDD